MRVEALVSSTAQQGFILWRDGDNVRFKGSREMSPDMIEGLRQQKLELLAYLKLRDIAGEMDWQLGDLLDWYKADIDMRDIARWNMEKARGVVLDYINNFELCRGEGYQLPRCELTDDSNENYKKGEYR